MKEQIADLNSKALFADGFDDAFPLMLSGGMRQRVALARTLMENRPVVLMDEPFSALDALTRVHLQTLASHLLRNCTVVLVTHDPWEALRLGHSIYILGGVPAKLGNPICPPGIPPRDTSDSNLSKLSHHLLNQLEISSS